MKLERNNILLALGKEETLYFVYSKNSRKDDVYNACVCKEEEIYKVVQIEESKLPEGTGIDSVLKVENDEFVLDKNATEAVRKKMAEVEARLLEEQERELQQRRIDGHLYEVVEQTGETVWLMDVTINDGECFEEAELLDNVEAGLVYKFINGRYYLKDKE